jgi:hypothetical protein
MDATQLPIRSGRYPPRVDLERTIRLHPHASNAGIIHTRGMGSTIQAVLRVSPISTLPLPIEQ